MSAWEVSSYTSPKLNSQIAIPFFLGRKEGNLKKNKIKKSYILGLEE